MGNRVIFLVYKSLTDYKCAQFDPRARARWVVPARDLPLKRYITWHDHCEFSSVHIDM